MNKKYELTNETITLEGTKLYRIRALRDFRTAFGNVKKGDLGGFVESEENLDQSGNSWLSGDMRVSGDVWVSGDMQVTGYERLTGDALVTGGRRVTDDGGRVASDACMAGGRRVTDK